MVPAKPLPFETPVTSTLSPSSNRLTSSVWPTSYSDTSSSRNSRACLTGGRPSSWPARGLVSLRCGARAELHGGVAVAIDGPQGSDGIRLDSDDRDGHHRAVLGEHRRHADFLANHSDSHLHLYLDVDARSKRESHQGVDRFGRRVEDVDQPLVSSDLELLAAVLVDER